MRLPLDSHRLIWALIAPDRLLAAQAMTEAATRLTADTALLVYSDLVECV